MASPVAYTVLLTSPVVPASLAAYTRTAKVTEEELPAK